MRTQVPVAIAFIMGVAMLVQFFVPTHGSVELLDQALMWARIIGGFALVVGIGSLVKVNADKIRRRSEGWVYSIIILIGLALMTVLGILGAPESERAWRVTMDHGYQWLYDNVQVPMDATIFSLLAFFIASAAYRTFRPRTLEAGLLLVAAIVVMLGRVPLGVEAGSWLVTKLHVSNFIPADWMGGLVEWILDFPNTAAKRAIFFGAALAAVAQALRIIVGIERPYMSGS